MHAVSRTTTAPATLSSRSTARVSSRRARAVVARASSSSDDVVPPLATLGERARNAALTLAASAALVAAPPAAMARLEGVNNPQMLPPGEPVEVLDVAGYLTKGEIARLTSEVRNLEKDTGIRLRVLAQAYPNTPGLAVKDYWKVDDDTVVFVADPGLGNILNFSVGANVDLEVPPSFWTRLAGKYGSKFYWQENGEEASISNAVSAIDTCFREDPGKLKCAKIQGELGEEPSSGKFGKAWFGQ